MGVALNPSLNDSGACPLTTTAPLCLQSPCTTYCDILVTPLPLSAPHKQRPALCIPHVPDFLQVVLGSYRISWGKWEYPARSALLRRIVL